VRASVEEREGGGEDGMHDSNKNKNSYLFLVELDKKRVVGLIFKDTCV